MTLSLTAFALMIGLPGTLWASGFRRKNRLGCLRPLHHAIFLRAPEMARLVRWECARTDRSRAGFALAVFPLGAAVADVEVVERFEAALRKHARLTDVVGWLNESSLCAVLVDADATGALTFATKLHQAAALDAPVGEPVIYTYGGKWNSKHNAAPNVEPGFAMSA